MTTTSLEPDDLKRMWQLLDARLTRQELLLRDAQRRRRLEAVRRHLRPLRWGQILQIPFGVAIVLASIACWRARWDLTNVRVAAMVMQAYGVALIAAGLRTLTLLDRLDYDAPVLAIQSQVARVQRWYAWTGLVFGMAWWLLWIPLVMMVAGVSGRDVLARAPLIFAKYAAACTVGLAVSVWLVRRLERSQRVAGRAWLAASGGAGRGLHRAGAVLDEIRRFEGDAEDEPAAPTP
jgi:hypothetical protein